MPIVGSKTIEPDALPTCLVVSEAAEQFAEEIRRLSPAPIPLRACKSAADALSSHQDETILFGNSIRIAEIIDQLPAIRWVQSSWAGVTHLIAAARRDYLLTGVKDVFGPQMSEYVFGYLLAHELKIRARERSQQERRWDKSFSGHLEGKCMGVMGTGSIGKHIATTADAFAMRVIGLNRSGSAVSGFDRVYAVDNLDAFLEQCDYLVGALPETPGTNHLLNAKTIRALPSHAYFVNVGRGNVVDDQALVEALKTGGLSGATLDVFDTEPLPPDSPLWTTPNLQVTAHIAAISHPLLLVPIFVENYWRYVRDEPLNHLIDFEKGY